MHGLSSLLITSGLLGVISAAMTEHCTDKYCFALFDDASGFEATNARCQRELYNARLLDTADRELRGETKKFLLYLESVRSPALKGPVFVDMRRKQTADMKWYTVDSGEFRGKISRQNKMNYGYLYYTNDQTKYVVGADHPTSLKPFLCELDMSICSGYAGISFIYLSHCYVKDARQVHWFEARSACVSKGGELAPLSFKEENDKDGIPYTKGIGDVLGKDPTGHWIGVRYMNMSWMSPSGGPNEVIANGWSRKKLNDPDFECACADPNGDDPWSWADCDCSAPSTFICYGSLNEFSLTTPPSLEDGECICNDTARSAVGKQTDKETEEELRQSRTLGIILAVIIPFVLAFVLAYLLFHKNEPSTANQSASSPPKAEQAPSVAENPPAKTK